MMYGKVQKPGRLVEDRDAHDLRVEDLLELVADEVVDRLRVELARDRLLHAVDQRELRVPLPRLVDEPRVLERDAQAAGQRRQQLLVGLVERVHRDRGSGARSTPVARPPTTSGTKSADLDRLTR